MSNNIVYELNSVVSAEGFSGRAAICANDGFLTASFTGSEDSYVLGFELPAKQLGAGVQARVLLDGWREIRYVAIGYASSAGYQHIKASNIRQEAWVDFGFTHQDIIWKLQNGMAPLNDVELEEIRVFIKGTPSDTGAKLKVARLAVLGRITEDALPIQPVDSRLLNTLYSYLRGSFREYEGQTKAFMETGTCPMPGGKLLKWPVAAIKPEDLDSVNTFRFAWHGQHPAINLLLWADQSGELGPVFAARTLVDNWLEHSYFNPDDDAKFAWYDHGTAERLLAFILLWAKGVELGFDQRFMQRLGTAILSHARLLHSEAFYAYHQPDRYHNHAWFQDAALVAVALAFPAYNESAEWLANAISRFEDQLDKLIVRDGGFAIFVENSIGYHHGVQRLAELVGALVKLSGQNTEIPTIASELVAWSDFLRYPDGRAPAQGDTFRLLPRTGVDIRRGKPWDKPGCTVLPKAGYAVVKGNHDGKPWMLCLFNTSLSRTHKHEDNLSITFWFDGVEWLIDPSFYSHEYDESIPGYLRSAEAHNTISLERRRYSKLTEIAETRGFDDEGGGFEVSAVMSAYEGVTAFRYLTGRIDCLEVFFEDRISMPEESSCPARVSFRFSEDVSLEICEGGFNLRHPDSEYVVFIECLDQSKDCVFERMDEGFMLAGNEFMSASKVDGCFSEMKMGRVFSWRLLVCDM